MLTVLSLFKQSMALRAQTGCLLAVLVIAMFSVASGAEYNAACSADKFCWELYTHKYSCEQGHCIRGEFTNTPTELLGYLVIIGICMVANAGGLGAGAVIIPVYMFMYDFSATDSIPLSKITICAGAIVNFMLSWNERDRRNVNSFLINYNMGSVIVPLLLAGTQ